MSGTALGIGRDHPALAGHFPDRPLVPAVIILDLVLAELERRHPQLRVRGVKKMKLVRPLLPDERFALETAPVRGASLRFTCRVGAELLAEGRLLLEPASATTPPAG